MRTRSLVLPLVLTACVALSGCSSMKRFSGALDDTVLPGERESILTPDQYSVEKPDMGTDGQAADAQAPDAATPADPDTTMQDVQPECDPAKDKDCPPPADNGGIFNDG